MDKLKILVNAVMAGICISIGGCAFLSTDNKVVGAAFFVVGLFVICTCGFNLYTGKVCYLFENNKNYAINILIIWIGNFIGCIFTAALYNATRISVISEKAQTMVEVKLNDSLWSIFILGIFCNMLIYIGVDGFKNNPHELGKYLSLFFGVMVFIICGFEHCVANMFYFSVANALNAHAIKLILVNTLGNAIGGWIFPFVKKLNLKGTPL